MSRTARLLIVDDNPDNREVLGRRLQRLGYPDLAYAADGVQAHEMLRAAPFDAVLLRARLGSVLEKRALRAQVRAHLAVLEDDLAARARPATRHGADRVPH